MREQSEARQRSAVEYADVDSAATPSLAGGGRRAGTDPRPYAQARRPRARSRAPAHVLSDWDAARRAGPPGSAAPHGSRPAAHRVQLGRPDVRLAAQAPGGTRHSRRHVAGRAGPLSLPGPTPRGRTAAAAAARRAVPGRQGIPRRQWTGDHGCDGDRDRGAGRVAGAAPGPGLVRRLRGHRGASGRSGGAPHDHRRRRRGPPVRRSAGRRSHGRRPGDAELVRRGQRGLDRRARLQRGDPRVHPQDRHARRRAGRLPAARLEERARKPGWQ